MKFDDLLRVIGEFGSYQKRVYFLSILPIVMCGFEALSTVFTFNIPAHRCAIPGYPDDQYHVINDSHAFFINASVPRDKDKGNQWSQCRVFSDVTYDTILASFNDSRAANTSTVSRGSANTTTCDRWVFDHSTFQSTIPTDFNIVCGRSVHRASSNMLSELGCVLGTLVSGFAADRFGRKIPFYIGALSLITGGFGIAFTTDLIVLNICRFIIGIARMVLWVNGLVIGMEIVGPSKRVFAGTFIEFTWCVGLFFLLVFAYFIRNWRYLEIAISVPSVGLLAYWWLLPESPRWLASKGRKQEVMQILKKIASSNHSTLPKVDDMADLLESDVSHSVCSVSISRELIFRIVVVFSNMFTLVIIYYALMFNITNLDGNIYINYLINTIMESLGLIAPYFVLNRFGRKKVYCASIFLGSASCVVCILPALLQAPDWVIVFLAITGRFFACVAFSTLYIYGAELFPTVIRCSVMGVGVTFSRLGGIAAPYLADLGILVGGSLQKSLPLVVMGCPALVAGVFAFWLPETKDRKLPETMRDLHEMQRMVYQHISKPFVLHHISRAFHRRRISDGCLKGYA